MAIVKPEYLVNLQGKPHPTYPGVLLAAREEGLLGLEVTILQYPSPDNGETAICAALVTMKGEDGRELVYQDVGDASPKNVNSRIALHIIRMASTRAKGRALRDAIGLGIALVEEMGGDVDADPPATGIRANGQVPDPVSQPPGAPPAAPLPVARHSPGTVGRSPAPGSSPPGPVVGRPVAATGELVCSTPDCGAILTRGQAAVSEKKFGKPYCIACQRALANTALHA